MDVEAVLDRLMEAGVSVWLDDEASSASTRMLRRNSRIWCGRTSWS
jgi:hypothetical protein